MVRGRRGAEFEMPNFGLNLRFGQIFPYNKGNLIMKSLQKSNTVMKNCYSKNCHGKYFTEIFHFDYPQIGYLRTGSKLNLPKNHKIIKR